MAPIRRARRSLCGATNAAIALSIVGAAGAILAALPGLVDFLFGIPNSSPSSPAKRVGLAHAGLNVAALGLFIASAVLYVGNWNGPSTGVTLGLGLSAAGVALTLVAGSLGWILVQTHHVGIPVRAQADETVSRAPVT